MYLFKNNEKINITRPTAKTVLKIKFFLSLTATNISFASSVIFMNPTLVSSILKSLKVFIKKLFF